MVIFPRSVLLGKTALVGAPVQPMLAAVVPLRQAVPSVVRRTTERGPGLGLQSHPPKARLRAHGARRVPGPGSIALAAAAVGVPRVVVPAHSAAAVR